MWILLLLWQQRDRCRRGISKTPCGRIPCARTPPPLPRATAMPSGNLLYASNASFLAGSGVVIVMYYERKKMEMRWRRQLSERKRIRPIIEEGAALSRCFIVELLANNISLCTRVHLSARIFNLGMGLMSMSRPSPPRRRLRSHPTKLSSP